MSNDLLNSVASRDQDAGQALLDLESDLETYPEQSFSVFRGPFGVARWQSSCGNEDYGDMPSENALDLVDVPEPDEELSHWFWGMTQGASPRNEIENLTLGLSPLPTSTIWQPEASQKSPTPLEVNNLHFNLPTPTPIPSPPTEDPKSWLLLSYYRDRIIHLISPQQHLDANNDPWSGLVMPCAMTAMAELTLGGVPSCACLALLNALLATSAFHLHASGPAGGDGIGGEDWVSGDEYAARAKRYLEVSLEKPQTESPSRRKSKYKDVLMAMLSLANAFVSLIEPLHPPCRNLAKTKKMVKGDPDNRLTYLLHAERFIRINGFKKPFLSRKRRTLHHCYAYIRIMAETTRSSISFPDCETDIMHDEPDKESTNDKFRVSRWTNMSDNMMIMEKDPDTARRDLHLEVPGHWTSTLFPELYGIAESFLLLLSQVIRLANERDLTVENEQGGEEGLRLREFTFRAKALEKSIYRLVSSSSLSPGPGIGQGTGPGTIQVQAMYTALLIFFYRRVHNLDAMLLQSKVLTIQDLLRQDQQHQQQEQKTVALVWPAFVAACEALLPESQGFFAGWFEGMGRRTGLVSIALAKGVCEFVWARRGVEEDGMVSWPEVLRGRGGRVLCT